QNLVPARILFLQAQSSDLLRIVFDGPVAHGQQTALVDGASRFHLHQQGGVGGVGHLKPLAHGGVVRRVEKDLKRNVVQVFVRDDNEVSRLDPAQGGLDEVQKEFLRGTLVE